MSSAAEPLTSDPIALQAMLAAERAENDRLRQIIKELQRHRFGRRAESLPIDQLLLGLEEAEQVEAEGFAREETIDNGKREARSEKRQSPPIAARCLPTCRALSRSSTSLRRHAPAAGGRCTSWAKTAPSAST